jgi:Metallo-beta-lactamase superfamily
VGPVRDGRRDPGRPDRDGRGRKTFDFLRAENGFSALIELQANGRLRRVLFDAGVTPDGLTGDLDRLGISPDTFEAIVLSHGHFDHVMGLDGLAERLERRNLPLLLHPDFWSRRRIVIPGRQAWELPVPSRTWIEGAGFQIVEDRQPSFCSTGPSWSPARWGLRRRCRGGARGGVSDDAIVDALYVALMFDLVNWLANAFGHPGRPRRSGCCWRVPCTGSVSGAGIPAPLTRCRPA